MFSIQLSIVSFRFVNLIVSAIKENGNTTDPKYNSSLAKVIKDAQAEGVQKVIFRSHIYRGFVMGTSYISLSLDFVFYLK